MKKTITIGLLLILFAFTSQSQEEYFKQNLEKASTEDLNLYLEKAQKQKKTGAILSIAGPITAISGALLGSNAWSGGTEIMWQIGIGMFVTGIGATVIGIPILITGSSRVKRINAIKNTAFNDIRIDLAPSGIYNYATQNYQPGITLRIRF